MDNSPLFPRGQNSLVREKVCHFFCSVISPSIYILFTIGRMSCLVNSHVYLKNSNQIQSRTEAFFTLPFLLFVEVHPWLSAPPVPPLLPVKLSVGRSHLYVSHIHHLTLYGRIYSICIL